jgi:CDP-diglyceride synthetase
MENTADKSIELPFELARRLLTTCEDVLLLSSPLPSTPFGRSILWLREVFDALLLNFHGASRMAGSAGVAIAISLAIPAFFLGLLQPLGFMSNDKARSYIYAGWMLLAVAIAFSKPSRYALTGYNQKNVARILERMPDLCSCSSKNLSAIQSCLQRAEDETKSRITTLKWTAGTCFAVAVYLAQQGFNSQNNELFGSASVPLVFSAFIAGFIAIHARGTTAVYGLAYAVVHCLDIGAAAPKTRQANRTRWLRRQGPRWPGL